MLRQVLMGIDPDEDEGEAEEEQDSSAGSSKNRSGDPLKTTDI